MKLNDALQHERERFAARLELRERKGRDYATTDDCLSNFKRMAQACKLLNIDVTTSYGVALFYSLLKIDRLTNLVFRKGATASNEPIEDTFDDLGNYLDLARECMIDDGVLALTVIKVAK
jgi:hypothetical protein